MAYLKSREEQKLIVEGGQILGAILEDLATMVEPGRTAKEIDAVAEKKIREAGGIPAFKGYKSGSHVTPFPTTICYSVNEEVVHGIANEGKVIEEGHLIGLDIGMRWPGKKNGLFTDTALSVYVGDPPAEIVQLMQVTKKALAFGIGQARAGHTVADIGRAIEQYVAPQGYGIVRDLCGHGVGHAVHEDPNVLNYYDESFEKWVLEPGVVIAIEPMLSMGSWRVEVAEDGWGIRTVDKSLSCHFEHTVIVTDGDPIIATKRPSEA